MAILSLNVQTTGLVGDSVNPRRISMVSTDSLSTITTSGYLNNINQLSGTPILPTDIFEVVYSYNQATQAGIFGIFQVTYSYSAGFSLVEWTNPGNVLLPVTSGDIAIFNGTDGQIKDGNILATNLMQLNVTNTMAAGSKIVLDKGTGTVSAGDVTINKNSGVITTTSLTTAAGSTATVTLTNSEIATSSVVIVSLMGGTNTTVGVILSATAAAGSSTITIENNNASAALNGTLIIGFSIF